VLRLLGIARRARVRSRGCGSRRRGWCGRGSRAVGVPVADGGLGVEVEPGHGEGGDGSAGHEAGESECELHIVEEVCRSVWD
jgi:hypothetical protein